MTEKSGPGREEIDIGGFEDGVSEVRRNGNSSLGCRIGGGGQFEDEKFLHSSGTYWSIDIGARGTRREGEGRAVRRIHSGSVMSEWKARGNEQGEKREGREEHGGEARGAASQSEGRARNRGAIQLRESSEARQAGNDKITA